MAPPPPKRLLSLDDIPNSPKWVEALLGPLNSALRPTAEALSQALTFRENFAGEVKTVTITPPEDWQVVEFAAGSGFASPVGSNRRLEVRKDLYGNVEARGIFGRAAGAPAAGTLASALWEDYLPGEREVLVTYTESPASVGSLSVSSTGLRYETGNATAITVSGLGWVAANRTPPRWATPVDVKLGTPQKPFPGRPGAVILLNTQQANDPTAPTVVTGYDITPINLERQKAAPGIRIHRVWGLEPGVAYSLTLLVLPE